MAAPSLDRQEVRMLMFRKTAEEQAANAAAAGGLFGMLLGSALTALGFKNLKKPVAKIEEPEVIEEVKDKVHDIRRMDTEEILYHLAKRIRQEDEEEGIRRDVRDILKGVRKGRSNGAGKEARV